MKTRSLAALLACASFAAAAAGGVEGFRKPADANVKAVETLRLDASASGAARLALPAIGAAARKSMEGTLAPNQIGVSRRNDVEAQSRIDEASLNWQSAANGFAAQLRITSPEAASLRTGLRFDALPRDLELRVAELAADGTPHVVAFTTGADVIKLARGVMPIEHWTASTDGVEQLIELWSPRRLDAAQLRFVVFDVSHLLQRPIDPVRAKVLDFTCHVDVACIAGADVANDSRAVARMLFTDGGSSFVCTGSLLNDRVSSQTPLFATANHCISTQAVAATLDVWFFYVDVVCDSGTPQSPTRLNNGAVLLMADGDSDFTLLRLLSAAPGGSFFLGWDPAPLTAGQAIFGIHHPDGSYQRYSSGTFEGVAPVTNSANHLTFANVFNFVNFTQGILEGGSSGSPLLTTPGNFHGTLFGGPSDNSCTGTRYAFYSDFNVAYPMVKTFLDGPNAADDYGDAPSSAGALDTNTKLVAQINTDSDADWFKFVFNKAGPWTIASFDPAPGAGTDVKGEIYAADGVTLLASNDDISNTNLNFQMVMNVTAGAYYLKVTSVAGATGRYGLRSIFDDYGDNAASASDLAINGSLPGLLGVLNDQDWFRLTFTQPGVFHVNTTGTTDTMGALYQSDGVTLIASNDDANFPDDINFGLTTTVTGASVLYLKVSGFDGETGAYTLQTSFTPAGAAPNYTDIWWNPAESGWGINLNHEADTIFATLFTYDTDNAGLWLVATMTRQSDGSYTGALYRTVGPAFNASPWAPPFAATQVGTMTITFTGSLGALVYSVNGTTVTKTIQRQVFVPGVSTTCTFTAAARNAATNYQDLWWNSPANSEPGWGINFAQQGNTIFATLFTYASDNRDMWLVATLLRQPDGSFSGDLLHTRGPVFNAVPWTPITFDTVGTMRAAFANGAAGTLTYTVNGAQVVKAIQREVFAATQSVCQ
jgi:lysyl endopeptidase